MELLMKNNFALALLTLALIAPAASRAADPIGDLGLHGNPIRPPKCEDIHFVAACTPLECDDRVDGRHTHSLTRYAYCSPTLNACPSGFDLVAKVRTCNENGCTNHALGFLECYEPSDESLESDGS